MQAIKNKTHTRLKAAALWFISAGVVFAGIYAVWGEFVQDKMIQCELNLGSMTFETPDIGQRRYCRDRPNMR